MTPTPVPILLPTNRPAARFYAGGDQIAAFRSLPSADEYTPEDWIASTTPVRGQAPAGLTTLPDGTPLIDAVRRDPVAWLGAPHVDRWGDDPMLLVKLLDAGQRLPVHAHPDDQFAAAELGAAHGKAEAWYILRPGVIHLGLQADVDRTDLAQLVARQDTTALLGLLHEIPVSAGDAVIVPPGTLHAIGRSVLLAEVQQPEDLSILLEWEGFALDGPAEGHLGIGFDRALQAVATRALTPQQMSRLVRRSVPAGAVFAPEADRWFRLDRVTGTGKFPSGFAVLITVADRATLTTHIGTLALSPGSTVLIPASAGAIDLSTDGALLLARPPAP